jgi:hypothetical protein
MMGLMGPLNKVHDLMLKKFGYKAGTAYFNKICVFVPLLLVLVVVQAVADSMHKKKTSAATKATTTKVKGKKEN